MKKSIENIWKEGFAKERLIIPRINALYNQKSISIVEHIIRNFKREIFLLLPIGLGIFLFNVLLDNDRAIFWGFASAIPCVIWFFIGKNQLKAIQKIDYKSNSFQYLISIREKIATIRRFNKNLAIYSVPIILFPMLIFTYYNQQGKSLGEILGVTGLDLPTASIFLFLPLFTILAVVLFGFLFKSSGSKTIHSLDALIQEMKTLSS